MGEYLAELNEQLEDLNDCLLALESSTGDTTEITQKIFRLAHTIKGNAATMGFEEIASVSHAFEDLLERVQEGTVELNDAVIEAMLAAFDHIRARAGTLDGSSEFHEDPAPLVARLRSLASGGVPAAAAPPPFEAEAEAEPMPPAGDPVALANEIAAEIGGLPPGLDLEELARLTGTEVPAGAARRQGAAGTSTSASTSTSTGSSSRSSSRA
jgi:two-component system chemotaxis sensor kinase CheA